MHMYNPCLLKSGPMCVHACLRECVCACMFKYVQMHTWAIMGIHACKWSPDIPHRAKGRTAAAVATEANHFEVVAAIQDKAGSNMFAPFVNQTHQTHTANSVPLD